MQNAEKTYLNTYRHCDQLWEDTWNCQVNDECPNCGKEIEPFRSVETPQNETPVIRSSYETIDEKGVIRYHSQQTFASVEKQMMDVLSTVIDEEGDKASQLLEWISFYLDGHVADSDEEFPKGTPFVSVQHGNCEGYTITVYVENYNLQNSRSNIEMVAAIKYLSNLDMVYEAGKVVSEAFYNGLYGYELPPGKCHEKAS